MRAFLRLIAAMSVAAVARASLPLQDGERLSYRVSWAIVPGAGEIKIAAHRDTTSGTPRLVVNSSTATRGLAKMLLPFSAAATSVFDLKGGRLLSQHETSNLRGKRSNHTVTFDYATHEAFYTPRGDATQTRTFAMPEGNPMDMMMALLQTRTWDLKPGEKRDALVLWDSEFYELTLYALGYEEVRTPLGRFNSLLLEPRMEKTPPKGMFRKGSAVRVWIAQDDHQLPVRFEVEFKIGTGTATLDAYEGPARRKGE